MAFRNAGAIAHQLIDASNTGARCAGSPTPAVAAKSLRQVQYWLTPPRCSKFAPYTIGICSVCLALDSSRGGGRIRVGEAVSADWFSNAFLPHLISRQ
jgi:hypothetical protein